MKFLTLVPLAFAAVFAVSCDDNATGAERSEDRIEQAAEESAAASGTTEVALGMTEWQLLDAEIVDASGAEIGDVERVLRNSAGGVDRLLIEIEDSNPDRYVVVPLDGLTTVQRGDDTDIRTTMTRADTVALPEADLTAL